MFSYVYLDHTYLCFYNSLAFKMQLAVFKQELIVF